jgi:hypothetical protein
VQFLERVRVQQNFVGNGVRVVGDAGAQYLKLNNSYSDSRDSGNLRLGSSINNHCRHWWLPRSVLSWNNGTL